MSPTATPTTSSTPAPRVHLKATITPPRYQGEPVMAVVDGPAGTPVEIAVMVQGTGLAGGGGSGTIGAGGSVWISIAPRDGGCVSVVTYYFQAWVTGDKASGSTRGPFRMTTFNSTVRSSVTEPRCATDPVTYRFTGARPGDHVEAGITPQDGQSAYLGEGSVVVNADGSGSVTIAAPARGWEKGPYLVWVEGEYDDHGQRVGAWLFKYTVDGATGGCSAGSKPGSTGTGTTGSGAAAAETTGGLPHTGV
ncbi:hypothetical protein HJ590_16120 [Naumannella sp. ID2617S]|nr:hypothetical protein [Naumannella sp. ID2617S]